jgi:hypothetical protein
MTFVIPAAQALGCLAKLRMQGSDSADRNIRAVWPNAGCIVERDRETKKEQIRIVIVFQIFDPSCQTRTKKVQIGRDYGLSGLH